VWEIASLVRRGKGLAGRNEDSRPCRLCSNVVGVHMESREECLREAAECDRLAQLANTQATRALLSLASFQWRKLAEKAANRQRSQWPSYPEAMRPN
jgi:hypothetical protein